MKFENSVIRKYILYSMEELMRNSFEFKDFDDSHNRMECFAYPDKGYIEVAFYGRETRWDDETPWVKYYERKIGCTEILNWLVERDKKFKFVAPDLERFSNVIWEEWRKARDEYYSDKE